MFLVVVIIYILRTARCTPFQMMNGQRLLLWGRLRLRRQLRQAGRVRQVHLPAFSTTNSSMSLEDVMVIFHYLKMRFRSIRSLWTRWRQFKLCLNCNYLEDMNVSHSVLTHLPFLLQVEMVINKAATCLTRLKTL